MAGWEPTRMKSQLRLTVQKLGQLQDKMESQAQITRRDIATLLRQGNIGLARAKARKLMSEDILSDLLQTLEMHVGVVLGHLSELERSEAPSPVVFEAAASIIIAAPQVDSRDLRQVRELLIQRFGPDFVRSVNDYASARVRGVLAARPPTAAKLDQYMFAIARANGVQWFPDSQPREKVNAISEMLDPSPASTVDITRLRTLCSHGLPGHPPWLRPKVWRLLLGTLPTRKESWDDENRKSRENYYDLVRRLLDPFSTLPPPTSPLAPLDASLMNVSQELSQVPPNLMSALQDTPEQSPLCPLDDTATDDIRINCAHFLDLRLRMIKDLEAKENAPSDSTPEIRFESMPEIRLDAPDGSSDEDDEFEGDKRNDTPGATLSTPGSPSSVHSGLSTTLLPSRAMGTHQKHASALLRLLYVHSCLNPANQSPHIASLLVPVYSALVEEVTPEDKAHTEADTFWLFEAIVGEVTELNDVEGVEVWTRKLSERLYWADSELADDLQIKGLDPALPHYSFRWLVPLLTHTLPLPSVMTVWDALFSRSSRERDINPKLEYLIDICTSMLLSTRGILLRLGRPGHKQPNMWLNDFAAVPAIPLSERELENAFAEGMTFLQQYPLEAAGGVEAVLQTAYDLVSRREAERNITSNPGTGFGTRLRDTVWKGLVSQAPIVESHLEDDESHHSLSEDDSVPYPTEIGNGQTLSSRLANTVWRGISNESAMEAPPSPTTPLSTIPPSPEPSSKALPDPPLEDIPKISTTSVGRSALWDYAGKLKDSDAAATLAKVSTNWRVKALDVWNKTSSGNSSAFLSPSASRPSSVNLEPRRSSLVEETVARVTNDKRRGGSLPRIDRSDAYSPPARPAFFRPPRDSMIFTGNRSPLSPTSGEISPLPDAASPNFRSLAMPEQAKPAGKSGPRPLLLNSASLITSGHSRTPTPTSGTSDRAWADSVRGKRPSPVHRDSMSSMSSISPEIRVRSRTGNRSELDSDTTSSRVVPLRSSRSPMAGGSRRATPTSSVTSSPPKMHRRMDTESSTQFGSDDGQTGRGWGRVDIPDSPPTGPSPPPPRTPDASSTMHTDVRVKASHTHTGSMALSESNETDPDKPVHDVHEVKLARRQLPRLSVEGDTSDSSATQAPSRSPRMKSKRIPPRLATARAREDYKQENGTSSQKTLAPERSDDIDNVTTPRAMSFEPKPFPTTPVSPRTTRRARKTSGDGNGEPRTRKVSGEGRDIRSRKVSEGREARVRKVSTDGHSVRSRKMSGERDVAKHRRDSSAVEGDDEGYNDLLSAYESEENAM